MEFEIPASNKKGEVTTLEGIMSKVADSLDATYLQNPTNMAALTPDAAVKMTLTVGFFRRAAAGNADFTFILQDDGGNSFLENPQAPQKDPRAIISHYTRTSAQTVALGFRAEDEKSAEQEEADAKVGSIKLDPAFVSSVFDLESRAAVMKADCSNCPAQCETRMAVTTLPKFKEIIIMMTECISCGYRDTEIKPSGATMDHGSKVSLQVTHLDDLKREVLKSDSAGISIPEIELEMMPGTLGGKYTTVEGLLKDIYEQLSKVNPFSIGDSSPDQIGQMNRFLQSLQDCIEVKMQYTFVLDDPLGNIYIGARDAQFDEDPDAPDDPQLVKEDYERTEEQNEEFGLNDIKVENYEVPPLNEEVFLIFRCLLNSSLMFISFLQDIL